MVAWPPVYQLRATTPRKLLVVDETTNPNEACGGVT